MKKITLYETNGGQRFETEVEAEKYLQSLINIGIRNMAEEIRDLEENTSKIESYIRANLKEFYRIIEIQMELDDALGRR